MAPITDITENNASNQHLSTVEGVVTPQAHAVFQSVDTMRAFLTDEDKVDNPWTDHDVDIASKNDLIFAIREIIRTGGLAVASVTIEGENEVAVDETVPLQAFATHGLGTEEDVTNTATWESSDETKATVNEQGVVAGVAAGTTNITATFKGVTSANFSVTVSA